jgi:hypothetical protein
MKVPPLVLSSVAALILSGGMPAGAAPSLPALVPEFAPPIQQMHRRVASQGHLVEFDPPGTIQQNSSQCSPYCGSEPYGINDAGLIVGFFVDQNVVSHAYIEQKGLFTSFDAPGAGSGQGLDQGTTACAISDNGTIVGQFADANSVIHGFIRSPLGFFTQVDAPGAGTGPGQGTYVTNVNLAGATAGFYFDANFVSHSFERSAAGTLVEFDPPGATNSYPCDLCLNRAGALAGTFQDSSGMNHGYVREPSGKLVQINVPGAQQGSGAGTNVGGLNLEGVSAGTYYTKAGTLGGYLRYPDGHFDTFAGPDGGPDVFGLTIDDTLTGNTAGGTGFYRAANGKIAQFTAADGVETLPYGLNRSNEVYGAYVDSTGLNHSFLWTP